MADEDIKKKGMNHETNTGQNYEQRQEGKETAQSPSRRPGGFGRTGPGAEAGAGSMGGGTQSFGGSKQEERKDERNVGEKNYDPSRRTGTGTQDVEAKKESSSPDIEQPRDVNKESRKRQDVNQ